MYINIYYLPLDRANIPIIITLQFKGEPICSKFHHFIAIHSLTHYKTPPLRNLCLKLCHVYVPEWSPRQQLFFKHDFLKKKTFRVYSSLRNEVRSCQPVLHCVNPWWKNAIHSLSLYVFGTSRNLTLLTMISQHAVYHKSSVRFCTFYVIFCSALKAL